MSLHFPPDKALEDRAADKLRKMLARKCFMERWEPVQKETAWVLKGKPDEKHHKKLLPDFCYNILALQRRTIFKVYSPLSDAIKIKNKRLARKAKTIAEAKKAMTIDWGKMGAVFAMGERCQMFFENELPREIQKSGVGKGKKKHLAELFDLLFGNRWLEKKFAKFQSEKPGKPVEEILGEKFASLIETTKKAVPEWHRKATEWSPEAVTNYHAGVTKGSSEFLDKNGELKGEKKIKLRETYEMLLIAWPEIQDMLKAKPPKTRNQLWDWLKTFSHARWIEIEDLDQLNRLCNEIKLKLKKPGAPQKSK